MSCKPTITLRLTEDDLAKLDKDGNILIEQESIDIIIAIAESVRDVYKTNGYANREAYLEAIAEDYNVDRDIVLSLAESLGPGEDFDGLIAEIQDITYGP